MQWCNLSPAKILQRHTIRTDVPQPKSSFISQWTHTQQLKKLHEIQTQSELTLQQVKLCLFPSSIT